MARSSARCSCSVVQLLLISIVYMRGVVPVAGFQNFKLQEHLATKAPYKHRVRINGAPSLHDMPDPPGYQPIFMWLLSRHGSRWPTAKRMRQINSLEQLFKELAPSARPEQRSWMQDWVSPTSHMGYMAGELHPTGDAEMMGLAARLRERFPQLLEPPYAPRRYPIISTQVARAAQSASAFSLGFFGRWVHSQRQHTNIPTPTAAAAATTPASTPNTQNGSNGGSSSSTAAGSHRLGHSSWLPQPVAVSMLPRQADPLLRFFETCRSYREHEDTTRRWLAPWMHAQIRQHIIPGLAQRLSVSLHNNLHPCHVEALWQLCAFEATAAEDDDDGSDWDSSSSSGSSSGNVSRACDLFSAADVLLMEWLDDVRLNEMQGYGAKVNYAIAAPLLSDLASALTTAAAAHTKGDKPPLQRARLHFAHCETLTPLATLMGLFNPTPQQQQQQQRQQQQGKSDSVSERAAGKGLLPLLPEDDDVDVPGELHAEDTLSDVEEEVLQDLPVLKAVEAAAAAAAAAANAAAGSTSGVGSDAAVSSSSSSSSQGVDAADAASILRGASATLRGVNPATNKARKRPRHHQQQQQQQQQQAVGYERIELIRRRRQLSATEFDAAAAAAVAAAAAAAGQLDTSDSISSSSSNNGISNNGISSGHHHHDSSSSSSSSGLSSKHHHHGPGMEGCGVGGAAAPSQEWMQPPPGWSPPFAAADADRAWRAGRVAPLGANMLLLLYGRAAAGSDETSSSSSSGSDGGGGDSSSGESSSRDDGSSRQEGIGQKGRGKRGDFGDVLVRLVYNEQVVKVPGCPSVEADGVDVSLQDFLEFVVGDKTAADRFQRYCYGTRLDMADSSSDGRGTRGILSFGSSQHGGDNMHGLSDA